MEIIEILKKVAHAATESGVEKHSGFSFVSLTVKDAEIFAKGMEAIFSKTPNANPPDLISSPIKILSFGGCRFTVAEDKKQEFDLVFTTEDNLLSEKFNY